MWVYICFCLKKWRRGFSGGRKFFHISPRAKQSLWRQKTEMQGSPRWGPFQSSFHLLLNSFHPAVSDNKVSSIDFLPNKPNRRASYNPVDVPLASPEPQERKETEAEVEKAPGPVYEYKTPVRHLLSLSYLPWDLSKCLGPLAEKAGELNDTHLFFSTFTPLFPVM